MRLLKLPIVCLLFISVYAGYTQEFKVHSHNDYKQNIPFWKALGAEVQSVEVDVFYKDGKLLVAHEQNEIQENSTLARLYLNPLQEAIALGLLNNKSLQLLIDVKSNAHKTLNAIVAELKEYPAIINADNVKIVISGNRPDLKEYIDYPDFIFFDYQSLQPVNNTEVLKKIALVSLSFKNYSEWNGKGRLTSQDFISVTEAINKAHALNKPFRFWATPDSKSAWKAFVDMGVDYINTDMPNECVTYVTSLKDRVVQNSVFSKVYYPNFKVDQAKRVPKNIILMIGDGNGLTQISSTVLANNGELSLTQLKSIGFIKTQSADDFTTDSAGAGTAIATGKKTNNRAIGTNKKGATILNLTEILSEKGFYTGVITTDEITGATPSSFYAHRTDRGMAAEIASDLKISKLKLFISQPTKTVKHIEDAGFVMNTDINTIGASVDKKIGAWFDHSNENVTESNVQKLALATKNGISYLNKEKPFFLMVEGAKIDSYGHANDIKGVVTESISFDRAVSEAIKFADEDGNTLVVVTADHETGGLTIPQGNIVRHEIEADFTTHDHTGTMVPVFAYGPMSQEFQGVYENNEIFDKLLKVLKIAVKK
ncbi:alkaline phosphatase [Maribacter sp. 1_2014MBL_MicDiv]|uniref:alkaline phosphatase n=1 Tax=Maribacter sp. 1_2014MBL_MicDiv TaxID=1644130 RepID=UPI0008F4F96E|nr:alkaline phosphatase [Maribacter sp. 1_2014MBL_MicDiv]APA65017.1 alkaline phosphatase [Maribacter sp. 1_2014MBL_MicDiv]